MLPRLEDHDRLFINKFVYHIESIQRGDVVVFHYPRDPEKSYIKRVIGLPGDRIWIDRGSVWVNGVPLGENYVPERYRDSRSMAEMVVPDDTYFMMGDHRSISSDSREFGPVERDLIYGKAVFVYWPARMWASYTERFSSTSCVRSRIQIRVIAKAASYSTAVESLQFFLGRESC